MPEQMEEVEEGMGFLDMQGGTEPPMAQPEMSHLEIGSQQYNDVLNQVVSRFKGGIPEILELIKNDEQDILDFKKDKSGYDFTEQVNMEDNDNDPADFLQGSIPGESLTGDFDDVKKGKLGKYPWETPPQINTIGDAFNSIVQNKENNPKVKEDIVKLLDAGVPSEAIARTVGFSGYLEGMWTVDISEIIVVPLIFEFVADAQDEGITARIFNDFEDDGISNETVLDIMEGTNPEKFELISQEADMMKRMPPKEEMSMEPEPMSGSFLDMETV